MNWLRNRLGSEFESVLADFIALVVAMLLFAGLFTIYSVTHAEEPQKTEVCRSEWGHRINCEDK